MKKLLLAIGLLSIVSCQSPEEKLISEAEDKLIENLKDPKSYERIEAKVVDTITSTDWAIDVVKSDEEFLTQKKMTFEIIKDYPDSPLYSEMSNNVKNANARLENSIKKLDSVKKSKEPNRIREIILNFKYRAKNSMGALDIAETGIEYLPDPTIFKDKFHLYEIK